MKWNQAALSAIAGLMLMTGKVIANPVTQTILASEAIARPPEIVLTPGRQSLIEFRNGETIQYISLADVHQIVLSRDFPVDSDQASLIVLRTIEPLNLKGVVEVPAVGSVRRDYPHETVYPTNLVVVTMNDAGEKRTYTFDLKVSLSRTPSASNGIAILPEVESQTQETLTLTDGRQANWRDIERGYVVALQEGYTSSTDPVVAKIRKFLALAEQNVPFLEAAQRVGLPFEVVEAIAEMGLQTVPTLNPVPIPALEPQRINPNLNPKPSMMQLESSLISPSGCLCLFKFRGRFHDKCHQLSCEISGDE